MNLEKIWQEFLNKINEDINPVLFDAYFAETKLVELNDNVAKVLVPTAVYKKHLTENYNDLIENVFAEITGSNFTFEFVTDAEMKKSKKNVEIINDNKEEITYDSHLKPEYTFDNFVVGESNKFAHGMALKVAQNPGMMYNPLFIYGNSGLGKTHLMYAIGNYIVKELKKNVLYVTSEQFVNEFIDLYRSNKDNNIDEVQKFKNKYRNIDVLMIDDIQYLQIANKAQQEFFNTFNDLYSNNKQIVVCSDRSPDDLKSLEDRLKTRFNGGLTVNIFPPDFELRMAIINKKIEGNTLAEDFPLEVKEYIASNCTSDIRKIEGTIIRVLAYATMMNESKITMDLAIDALKDYFGKNIISKNKIDQVQQLVAAHYNISVEDMKSKKRNNNVKIPRQVAMYICRNYLEESFPKIGLEFGGKDHSTVMHSVEKIKKELKINRELENEINKIIEKIK